jgi:hypothetical protein
MTTIGYGAILVPQSAGGRAYLALVAWISMAEGALLIEAITTFASKKQQERVTKVVPGNDPRSFDLLDTTESSNLNRKSPRSCRSPSPKTPRLSNAWNELKTNDESAS